MGIWFKAMQNRVRFLPFATSALALVAAACTAPAPPPPVYHPVAESPAPLDQNPQDIALLNRIDWGANTASAQRVAAEGVDRYLEEQLHPSPDDHLPPEAQAEIAGMAISRESLAEMVRQVREGRADIRAA
jgi:hypothetical protein